MAWEGFFQAGQLGMCTSHESKLGFRCHVLYHVGLPRIAPQGSSTRPMNDASSARGTMDCGQFYIVGHGCVDVHALVAIVSDLARLSGTDSWVGVRVVQWRSGRTWGAVGGV